MPGVDAKSYMTETQQGCSFINQSRGEKMGKRRFLAAVMAGCTTAATLVSPAAADPIQPPPSASYSALTLPNSAGPVVTDVAGGLQRDGGPVLVPPGTGSPELEALRRLVSSPTSAFGTSPDDVIPLPQPCWYKVRIRSLGNNLYVAADHNLPDSPLRARTSSSALGTWEEFTVCRNANNWQTAIQSDKGKWVWTSLDPAAPGKLAAWDSVCQCSYPNLFTTYTAPGKGTSTTWFYSLSQQKYVSNQLDYTGNDYTSLRARLGEVGIWEWFAW
ncbi:hypothetical protein ABT369_09890 [Dactylosporangium sp. NPDC000244]|uniref:fascin domain-containing protein n=1 Tax=Dactylosporangium sp. NPDC000244 TaxID=3154365 RepID=UPI0033222AC4